MSYGWALLLGAIQGLTEFLPVSSSGHLALAGHWGFDTPQPLAFDLALHLATLGVVFFAFMRDLVGFARRGRMVFVWLAVASVPAAVAGLGFRAGFEALRERPAYIALGLLATAALLFFADAAAARRKAPAVPLAELGVGRSLCVGLLQALALAPGISRSGATVSGGLLCGLGKDDAVRFGFCLMLPAVGGASLLEALRLARLPAETLWATLPPGPLAVGMLAAAATGYFALRVLFVTVRRGRLRWFSLYCAAVAAVALIVG